MEQDGVNESNSQEINANGSNKSVIETKESILIQKQSYRTIDCCIGSKSRSVCINQKCKENAFICSSENCKCFSKNHYKCQQFRLDTLLDEIYDKKGVVANEIQKSFNAIEKIYKQMMDKLSEDLSKLHRTIQLFGLRENQQKFIQYIQNGNERQVTGQLMYQVKKEVYGLKLDFNFVFQSQINSFWQYKQRQFNKLRANLENLFCGFQPKLISKVTTDQLIIEDFLGKKVKDYKLLYRASENNFQTAAFHQKCDNIKDTIIVAQTQFDKIIGGYTPLTWNSTSTAYSVDNQNKSFIFSLSMKQKFQQILSTNAIYCHAGGPIFGSGHDLHIANNSLNSNGNFNFPTAYNNGKYQKSQNTYTAWSGATNGYTAKVKEWEVYQIQWS